MRIGVPKETADGERRVALIPDVVKSLRKSELDVAVESGAGAEAGHPDEEYADAEAQVGGADAVWGAEVVAHVAVPSGEEIGRLSRGQVLISHLAPLTSAETTKALREAGVTSFAMEAIPDEVADATSLVGTEEQVAERIERYREVGVSRLIVSPVQQDAEERAHTLERMAAMAGVEAATA